MTGSVRVAAARDGPALADLLAAFEQGRHVNADASAIEGALSGAGPEAVFVAEDAGRLVGFASVQLSESFAYNRPTAELTNLFVRPDCRRAGHGRRLLAAVRAHAEAHRALELFARVNEANDAAIGFYTSQGLDRARHAVYRFRPLYETPGAN